VSDSTKRNPAVHGGSIKTDPNAPAFPVAPTNIPAAHEVDPDTGMLCASRKNNGLTTREEFAKSQMAALTVACAHCFPPSPGEPLGAKWIRLRGWLALLAVEQADALIAELNKTP
jgi:hypothetical protein